MELNAEDIIIIVHALKFKLDALHRKALELALTENEQQQEEFNKALQDYEKQSDLAKRFLDYLGV